VGGLEWREESSEVRERSQEIGILKILQVNLCFWEESEQKNTDKKNMGPYNRCEERICTKNRKCISIVKREERHTKL